MKALFGLIFSLLVLSVAGQHAWVSIIGQQAPVAAGGGGACTTQAAANTATKTGSAAINDTTGTYYQGIYGWTSGAITVCKVTAYLTWSAGDISTNTFYCDLYSYDDGGTFNLTTLRGTSDGLLGTNTWSASAVDFNFSTPVSLSAATKYAVVFRSDMPSPSAFCALLDYGSGAGIGTGIMHWNVSKAYVGHDTTVGSRLVIYKQ